MSDKFTIRPRPAEDEILTSYLQRVSKLNFVRIIDVWKYVNTKFLVTHFKDAMQLDINHVRIINVDLLSKMLNISSKQLNNMTFTPLFQKFFDQEECQTTASREFIQNLIVTKSRRFCPECLNDGVIFKRQWQVAEIKICNKHYIELIDICKNCERVQPYISNSLVEGCCAYCEAELNDIENNILVPDSYYLEKQLNHYREWDYLLNPANSLIPDILESKRKSLAISLLFVAQGQESIFNKNNIEIMPKDYLNRTIKYIRGDYQQKINKPKRIRLNRPTLPMMLNVLRKVGMSIECFAGLNVPEEYIQSLLYPDDHITSNRQLPPIKECLAPWCRSYGSNKELKKIYIVPQYIYKKKYFDEPHICNGCHVIYGVDNKIGKWSECEDHIKVGWEKVRPLLNMGYSQKEIMRRLKVGRYQIRKIIGYFLAKKLVDLKLTLIELEFCRINNPVKYFKQLHGNNEGIIHASRKLFGWSFKVFWYHYYSSEVQNYLYFERDRSKGRVKRRSTSENLRELVLKEIDYRMNNNWEINVVDIANSLGCTVNTLVRYKLSKIINKAQFEQEVTLLKEYYWNETKKYIELKHQKREKITYYDYINFIGKEMKWLKKRFPEIIQWLHDQKKINDFYEVDLSLHIGL